MSNERIFNPDSVPPFVGDYYKGRLAMIENSIEGLRRISNKPLPPIIAYFIERRDFVARVYPTSARTYIEMSVALPILLNTYFSTLLSSGTFLREIDENLPTSKVLYDNVVTELPEASSIQESMRMLWENTYLNEEVWNSASWALAGIAFNFLYEHEISHIELGHAANLNIIGISSLSEIMDFDLFGSRSKNVKKVWEYEADIRASWTIVEMVLDTDMMEYLSEALKVDVNDRLFFTGIAASAIFSVFHILHLSNKGDESHPHPMVRFCYIMEYLCTYCCKKNKGFIVEEVMQTMFDAAYNTYHSWKDVGANLEYNLSKDEFWKSKYDHIDRIEKNRQKHYKLYYKDAFHYPFPTPNY